MSSDAKRPPPTAVQVEVRRCRDLHDTSLLGKMDPFVEIAMGTKKQKTQTHSKGGRFPTWNQTLTFTYDNEHSINFRVIDKDMMSNDYVGCHDLHLGPIVSGSRNFDGELPLSRKKGKPAGYIHVAVQFYGEIGGEKTQTAAPVAVAPAPKPAPVQQVAPYQPPQQPVPVPAPYAYPYQQPYPAAYPQQPYPQPYAQPPQQPGIHVVVGAAPPAYSPFAPPSPVYSPYPSPGVYPQQPPAYGAPVAAAYGAPPAASPYYQPAHNKKSKKKKSKKRSASSSSSSS